MPRANVPVMTVWLLIASIALCLVSIWIVLPPPHARLLPLAVGAPEISPWLLLVSVILCAVTFRAASVDVTARVVFSVAAVSAVLCAYPLVRAPFVLAAFDNAMERGLGKDYESQIPADARAALRTYRISAMDFARGISRGDVLIRRGIEFARPNGVPLIVDVYRPVSAGPRSHVRRTPFVRSPPSSSHQDRSDDRHADAERLQPETHLQRNPRECADGDQGADPRE